METDHEHSNTRTHTHTHTQKHQIHFCDSIPSPACIASVRVQSTPRAANMPRYGGSPVRALKAGTERRPECKEKRGGEEKEERLVNLGRQIQ